MIRVVLPTLPFSYLMGVSVPDVFRIANRVWLHQNPDDTAPPFDVTVAGHSADPVPCFGGIRILPDAVLGDLPAPDLVIVPGINRFDDAFFDEIRPTLDWLSKMHGRGVPIATFCTGAFVLAETGLLHRRTATTHWAYEPLFRARYPEVRLRIHRLITDEGDLICAGGLTAGVDLCVYLIARLLGPEPARLTAKVLLHDPERKSQLPYTSFRFSQESSDRPIQQAKELIEGRYADPFDIAALARQVGLGRRTLERRFKRATGETPLTYLQGVRVEAAKKLLEEGDLPFEEITARVGYEDISSFRKLFIKHTGVSPFAYKKKFAMRWPASR